MKRERERDANVPAPSSMYNSELIYIYLYFNHTRIISSDVLYIIKIRSPHNMHLRLHYCYVLLTL